MTLKLSFESNPKPSDIQALADGIKAYALVKKALPPWDYFAFFIRDQENKVMAGCDGNTLYGCLYIDQLWVSETIRHAGWGTKLINAALDYGKKRGCTFANVDTMDWEALDFYKKIGFTVELERKGFHKNSISYSLRKALLEDEQSKTDCIKSIGESNFDSSVPNTNYKLELNAEDSFKIVDQKLFEFNKSCVPPTQNPEVIDVNFTIKNGDEVIAGICSEVYTWKILYISVFFVEEKYRNQGLGSVLLNKLEEQAKQLGVNLIHLDTFDFQAKDFYLKHGYEVFGILDDCPKGHKRYYMKKIPC